VLAAGDPDVTQQRVVTEYGYEAEAGQRDERGREGRVKRGCGGGVKARLGSGGEIVSLSPRTWTMNWSFKRRAGYTAWGCVAAWEPCNRRPQASAAASRRAGPRDSVPVCWKVDDHMTTIIMFVGERMGGVSLDYCLKLHATVWTHSSRADHETDLDKGRRDERATLFPFAISCSIHPLPQFSILHTRFIMAGLARGELLTAVLKVALRSADARLIHPVAVRPGRGAEEAPHPTHTRTHIP